MALIRKTYYPAAGGYSITDSSLAYVTVLMATREMMVHHNTTINSPTDPLNLEYIHYPSAGQLQFSVSRPFGVGEVVNVLIETV